MECVPEDGEGGEGLVHGQDWLLCRLRNRMQAPAWELESMLLRKSQAALNLAHGSLLFVKTHGGLAIGVEFAA